MKVSITPAQGATIEITTKDGKKITTDQIRSIEIEPFFPMSSAPAEVLYGSSVSAARGEVDKFTLVAAGNTGKVTRRDKVEKSVIPSIDKPAVAAKPKAATPTTPAKS